LISIRAWFCRLVIWFSICCSDRARLDVGERLRGDDDRRVLFAQCFQPLPNLPRETRFVEREPPFIDDEERRPSLEPVFDAVEVIGENGERRTPADEAFRLEHLHIGRAKPLGFGPAHLADGDMVWTQAQ
jgi:hypothetical protein